MVMHGEQSAQTDNSFIGRIEEIQTKLDVDLEFSRRSILKGLGAVSIITALQGLAVLEKLGSEDQETLRAAVGDICPDLDIRCYLEQAQLDVPSAMVEPSSQEVVLVDLTPPSTEVAPPTVPATVPLPPETTLPPPPVAVPAPQEAMAMHVEELPTPERRNMSYEEFIQNAEQYLSVLPRLEQMHTLFPGTAFFNYIPEQYQHIEFLKQSVQPSVEKYQEFAYDLTYSNTFNQTTSLRPRAFVWHWTGAHYETPDKLSTMKPNSVQLYVHNNAQVYQMVSELDVVAGHARALNDFSWGMEMYSGGYDGDRSPLFNFVPPQVENGIYTAVRQLRSHNLPVNQFTILGHYAADLIFMNPYYDPSTGTFHPIPGHKPINVHKFDPPQEFIDMVVEKAMVLDAELGPR